MIKTYFTFVWSEQCKYILAETMIIIKCYGGSSIQVCVQYFWWWNNQRNDTYIFRLTIGGESMLNLLNEVKKQSKISITCIDQKWTGFPAYCKKLIICFVVYPLLLPLLKDIVFPVLFNATD